MLQETMFNSINLKGYSIEKDLKDFIYVEIQSNRDKIKSTKNKFIKKYKKIYDLNNSKNFIECNFYNKTNLEYCKMILISSCYNQIINWFEQLYQIKIMNYEVKQDNLCFEFFIKYLRLNNIKFKYWVKKESTEDLEIIKIDESQKNKLIDLYSVIAEPEKLIRENFDKDYYFNNFSTLDTDKENLLYSIKDAINNGYCNNYDNNNISIKEKRFNLINVFKKYNIKFTIKKIKGAISFIKNKFIEYKLKIIQILKKSKKIASFSGGKDSAYMILKSLEEGIKYDYIIFGDTGLEYPEMYSYIDKFEKYIKQNIIRVKSKITFDDIFFKPFAYGKNKGKIHGFPYVIGDGCWIKRDLKLKPIQQFKKSIDGPVVDYIGIAADEPNRYKKLDLEKQQAPLVDWGITEKQCRDELNNIGLLNPLYSHFKRLGCWLCPKQCNHSLKILFQRYPTLWEKLKYYQSFDNKPFKPNLTVKDIEKKILLTT